MGNLDPEFGHTVGVKYRQTLFVQHEATAAFGATVDRLGCAMMVMMMMPNQEMLDAAAMLYH